MTEFPRPHINTKLLSSSGRTVVLLLLQLTVLILLTGCISTGKRTNLPVELPKTFSLDGSTPVEQKWWLDFDDENLNTLIEKALADNFDILAARDRILEVEAVAKQAGSALAPSLDATGNASTARNYQTKNSTNLFSLGLAASYELDLWGRLRLVERARLDELKATQADYDTAILSLAAEVAVFWFELSETNLQYELLRQQQETNSKVLQVITAQFRAGKTGIADVLQQRQLVEANSSSLAELKAEGKRLQHQLLKLLALPPTSTLPDSGQLPNLPGLPESGVPLDLLMRRPDVNSSFLKLKAADSLVAAAVAERLPRLSISAGLSTSGSNTGDLFNNWFTNLGANLFGPLFDGGRRVAEVERNKAIARQNYYSYGNTILNSLVEVENALVREEELQTILTSLKTQLQLAAETIEHVGNRYRQGAEDYQRVLLALLSHQNLQRDLLRTRKQMISNRVALYRALSGRIPSDNSAAQDESHMRKADPTILTPLTR